MDIRSLAFQEKPTEVQTQGVEWHSHILTVNEDMQPRGDYEVQRVLQNFFRVKRLDRSKTIQCWYDVLRNTGDKKSYLYLENVHMMGVFYKENQYGDEIVTHFFIRKLDGFWGTLDRWKDDLVFPSDTRKYSVCAILPRGFVMPQRGREDARNHSVTQYTWERMEELGVKLDDILDYITAAQFLDP